MARKPRFVDSLGVAEVISRTELFGFFKAIQNNISIKPIKTLQEIQLWQTQLLELI